MCTRGGEAEAEALEAAEFQAKQSARAQARAARHAVQAAKASAKRRRTWRALQRLAFVAKVRAEREEQMTLEQLFG